MRTLAPPTASWLAAGAGSVLWAAAIRDPRLGLAAAGAGLFAAVETVRALVVLYRQRRAADDWLWSATGDFVPPGYAWRARQLRAACERLRLAHTLRLIERRAGERRLGAYGLPRLSAVSEHRDELKLLASRLERVDQPVTPAGVLRVADLISDGTGPLWNEPKAAALGDAISSTLAVLTPKPNDSDERAQAA